MITEFIINSIITTGLKKMANGLSVTGHQGLMKAAHLVDKYKGALERQKANAEQMVGRAVTAGLTVGGGAITGLLRAKGYSRIEVLNSDTDLIVGSLLGLTALTGMAGKYSEQLGDVANGMLAVYIARTVEATMRAK
jgi:hypothetical protein